MAGHRGERRSDQCSVDSSERSFFNQEKHPALRADRRWQRGPTLSPSFLPATALCRSLVQQYVVLSYPSIGKGTIVR